MSHEEFQGKYYLPGIYDQRRYAAGKYRKCFESKLQGGYYADGEKQIKEYLDYWNLNTGYMLSFNFNKNKEQGVKRVRIGDKVLFEGTV